MTNLTGRAVAVPYTEPTSVDEKRGTLSRVRDRVVGRLHEVGRRVEQTKDALNVARMIRSHPLTAAGIALAAGAVVGFSRKGRLDGLITGIVLQLVKSRLDSWAKMPPDQRVTS